MVYLHKGLTCPVISTSTSNGKKQVNRIGDFIFGAKLGTDMAVLWETEYVIHVQMLYKAVYASLR